MMSKNERGLDLGRGTLTKRAAGNGNVGLPKKKRSLDQSVVIFSRASMT